MSDGSDGRIEWLGRDPVTVEGVVERVGRALEVRRSPRDVIVIDRGCIAALIADWRKRGEALEEMDEKVEEAYWRGAEDATVE